MIPRIGITVTTAAAALPVSVAEVKSQSRIDISDDDTLVERLINAATKWVENHTRRALITRTVTYTANRFPDGRRFPLDLGTPLQSITSVSYYDASEADTVYGAANYFTDTVTEPGAIVLDDAAAWPDTYHRPDAVRIVAVVGMGDTSASIPEDLRHAILLLVSHLYEHRESVSDTKMHDVPFTVQSLLAPYDRPLVY